MHLLAVQSGVIDDGSEAVDLGQEPGDVVVLSAADTELAALAGARDAIGEGPSLRLANLMQLAHNMSVDVYVEKTLAHARLVVLRLLGGSAYWPYGLDQVAACCRENGIALAVLPGDAKPDPDLLARSTLPLEDCEALWAYLTEGGPENAANFLRHAFHLVGEGEAPPPARPLVKAGLYWPGLTAPRLDDIRAHWTAGAPVAPIVFYRALLEAGNAAPVEALSAALAEQGLNPLPVFVSSLKEEVSAATVRALFAEAPPAVILNGTGFAVAGAGANPLAEPDRPVLQVVFSGSSREQWQDNPQGLSARDLAMNVVLPELDGRLLTRAVSFKSSAERHPATQCNIVTYRPEPDRVDFVARLAANWARLGRTPPEDRRVGIVLANYPNRDGRIGNGVGYDTPAATVAILNALGAAGYDVHDYPGDGTALIHRLTEGPTNSARDEAPASPARLSLDAYCAAFADLPDSVQSGITERWGPPELDPFIRDGAFHLPVALFGNVAVAIQPARGYQIDPKDTYHDPALVPPHGYLAFHIWLREAFGAQAVIHNGKHGNLEWLPGKALALSPACYPEAALGPLPNIYPFIVNDPGEGSQAKRRTSAVIVDHLTPPLTRAESYGPLKHLEALVDEYYLASGLDARRMTRLRNDILEVAESAGLDLDAGLADCDDEDEALQRLDAYICDLKEAQIRDGLHILGSAPEGRLETDLLVALARVPRGLGTEGDASLIRALSADLGLGEFDPLDCDMAETWTGPRPDALDLILSDPWRTAGDTVERLEALAAKLVESIADEARGGQLATDAPSNARHSGESRNPEPSSLLGSAGTDLPRTETVLDEIRERIRPALRQSGPDEIGAIVSALDGRFIPPGPSGAPTRGRVDVLPTGRNFYSIDSRSLPTPAAWALGETSAARLVERHLEDHGNWPKALGLSAWGTSNMRTGGDDIAQALALIGAKPVWDTSSWRVTGFEIVPLAKLGRPRVDVTLRVSGFFRDAFPAQMDLFDSAVRAIGALDEDAADNPIAARMTAEAAELEASGVAPEEAARRAGYRIFGSKPGAYGAGLQAMIDEKLWDDRADLAETYLGWGGYAYGSGAGGAAEHETFRRRLGGVEAVVHNQDNREHDVLDSDDYYQFEGGMTAAVEHLSGTRPTVYHNDHSRPERPVVRTLEEEIGRVVRSRVVNPKWIAGVRRHGYKGAFEIVATVDYMFAFAATTGAVKSHHFELAYQAFIADEEVRDFIAEANPAGLAELAERFREAMERGLWTPRSNSASGELARLAAGAEVTEETL